MANYVNPIGPGLIPDRIDMGVDYTGSGPLYALGAGLIVNVNNSGWPGGKFIGLKLDTGQIAYYAENIIPHVSVGDRVIPGQLIGTAVGKFPYVEVGWAAPPGTGTTMAAVAGQAKLGQSQGDPGKYSTGYGVSMSNLIKSLGGPGGIITPGGVQGTAPGVTGISTQSDITTASVIPAGCLPGAGLVAMVYFSLHNRLQLRWTRRA